MASRPRPEYVPGHINDPSYVRIFDTTLRDGEQSPGATLTEKEKLDIARMLHKLGVDIIEAGFPVASPGDFAAVRQIAEEVGNSVDSDGHVPVICGLSRTKLKDLEARLQLEFRLTLIWYTCCTHAHCMMQLFGTCSVQPACRPLQLEIGSASRHRACRQHGTRCG